MAGGHIYIYIYIQREREREIERKIDRQTDRQLVCQFQQDRQIASLSVSARLAWGDAFVKDMLLKVLKRPSLLRHHGTPMMAHLQLSDLRQLWAWKKNVSCSWESHSHRQLSGSQFTKQESGVQRARGDIHRSTGNFTFPGNLGSETLSLRIRSWRIDRARAWTCGCMPGCVDEGALIGVLLVGVLLAIITNYSYQLEFYW